MQPVFTLIKSKTNSGRISPLGHWWWRMHGKVSEVVHPEDKATQVALEALLRTGCDLPHTFLKSAATPHSFLGLTERLAKCFTQSICLMSVYWWTAILSTVFVSLYLCWEITIYFSTSDISKLIKQATKVMTVKVKLVVSRASGNTEDIIKHPAPESVII